MPPRRSLEKLFKQWNDTVNKLFSRCGHKERPVGFVNESAGLFMIVTVRMEGRRSAFSLYQETDFRIEASACRRHIRHT